MKGEGVSVCVVATVAELHYWTLFTYIAFCLLLKNVL